MKIFLSIAWRNIMRNKKRSFITIFAIAVGLFAVIFLQGLMDGRARVTAIHPNQTQVLERKEHAV